MAQFAVNPGRLDPYKNFKFRVSWDGRIVAGVSRVSPLLRTTEIVEHREGGDISQPRKSPGKTRFEPITLERGITHDTAFEDWANLVFDIAGDAAVSLASLRKDIRIEIFNLSGQLVLAYNVYRCWVYQYQPLPELDANGQASTAFERLVINHEGWERDKAVTEPQER